VPGGDREAAWYAVHTVLERLPGWRVTRAELHEDEGRWHVTAVDARPRGRQARHEAISATGTTEVEALERLSRLLEERAAE
jgi:hypothetical protein